MTYQQKVGVGARHRRIDCRMNQKQLAAKIGWDRALYNRFECGRWTYIDPQILCRIAAALGMTVDTLLTVKESDNA